MNKSFTKAVAIGFIMACSVVPSLAKDSAAIQADANTEAAKANAKATTAAGETANSAAAVSAGEEGNAARHAKKAAKEQKEANKKG